LKTAWDRDRDSRIKSFANGDYSSRKTPEYRKLQSDRRKRIYNVSDPGGNLFSFNGLEEMKSYFANLNKGKSLTDPNRISPTHIAWNGYSKDWKLIK
jgi:hypothetical protein